MKHKSLLFAFPLFALALAGCVKYNGKGSPNPVDPADIPHITLSATSVSVVEGETVSISAEVDQDCTIYWVVPDQNYISISTTEGPTTTVTGLNSGKSKVIAHATNKGVKRKAVCEVSVSRKTTPGGDDDPSQPVEDEVVTTYLVIGENGRYKGEAGKDIAELYLEYAVEFTAKVGSDLPTSEDVTSTVTDSSFQYWQAYNGDGKLTHYDKVPNVRGKILYACFGGGSGEVTPVDPTPVPTGSITLYFAGIGSWGSSDLANTTIHLGINNEFVDAASVATGVYKETLAFRGSSFTINTYISQISGDTTKYFHPYSGVRDGNDMYSTIQTGNVSVVDGGTYTITWTGWEYDKDNWAHAWFNYTFAEGEPSDTPVIPDPPVGDPITFTFAGIESWEDPTEVYFIFDGDTKQAAKQANGKYQVSVTVNTVSHLQCYMHQNNGTPEKYFHPYNGSYEKMNSDINLGSVTITAGQSYVVTFTGWHDDTHWEYENDGALQHGWFNYTFALAA